MKIGIDARMYGKGYGLGRYVEELVFHLQKSDVKNEYVIFLKSENFEACKITNKNFTKRLVNIPWYGFQEQLFFPIFLYKEKCDLIHFPHWNVPAWYIKKFVVTIHDLTMYHFSRPEATTRGRLLFFLKDRAHRLLLFWVSKRASHVFATSFFVKKDIEKTLGIPENKITVTYQEPSVLFQQEDQNNLKNVFQKPYILYVGAAYPHKNLKTLLLAWNIFEQKHPMYSLVFSGKPNYFYDELQKSSEWKNTKRVSFLGLVPDSDLVSLYKNASLFVFPSLSEGFGLPPLEALRSGVPVASSNASCLPEILGESAIFFDPYNEVDMARGMEQAILASRILPSHFFDRFSFEKSVKQMISWYEKRGNSRA